MWFFHFYADVSIQVLAMPRGDTMQKWHIFRKIEKFSKRSDGF